MNQHDRRTYFSDIFQILKPRLEQWTMFEVLQFLVIIRSPFSDMVRSHKVNGNLLVNVCKLEKLFASELNAHNILPYLKMLMVVQEIRGTNPFAEHVLRDAQLGDRPRPRSMMIEERLLRAIQVTMERITDRPFILWTTEQLVELLQAMNFRRFVSTVQSCRIDGFILMCVASDWDCLCRLKKYLPAQQIQQINFVSQVLLAEIYFARYYKEDQEVSPSMKLQPQVKIEVNKNLKEQLQPQEQPEMKMLQKSAEEMTDDNDFFLAYGQMSNSIVKESEPSEDSNKLGRIYSEEEPVESRAKGNHFFMSQDSLGERKGLISHSMGHNNSDRHSQTNSQHSLEILRESGKQSHGNMMNEHHQPLTPIQEDVVGSQEERSKYAESYYPDNSQQQSQLAESYVPEKLAESYVPEKLAESYVPENQLAESFIPQNQMAESQYNSESIVQSQYSNSVVGQSNNNNSDNLMISSIEEPNRLNDLRGVTLQLPFDLLSFESLHLISLVEMSELTHEELVSEDFRNKTFSIRGVRFGRDKQNDYSYPDELSISSKHAIIVFRDESFHLQDLGSKTGTFKQLTNRTELYEGMKLQLSHVIEFTVDKISSKEDQGLIMLVFQKPETMPRYQARIKNGVKLTIGRGENCSIPIDGKKLSISMRHAEILYQNGKFFFCDISQNGSYVRLSQKGLKSEPMKLQRGDRFRISSKKMFLVSDIKSPNRLG